MKQNRVRLDKCFLSAVCTSLCLLSALENDKKGGKDNLACENNHFSSLLAARDVSRGGTSATQRQKFHTDDIKSVRNPVISAD